MVCLVIKTLLNYNFAAKFKTLLSSSDSNSNQQLAQELFLSTNNWHSLGVTSEDLLCVSISEDVVLSALKKLKRGKREVVRLSSDHLILPLHPLHRYVLRCSQQFSAMGTCPQCSGMQLLSKYLRVGTKSPLSLKIIEGFLWCLALANS